MANKRGKAVDNTHLSIDMAHERGFIHRDYLAHCLRWTHVAKFLREKGRYKDAVVLDVGCGRDLPLARMLHTDRMTPKLYVGVDYNKTEKLNTYKHNFGDKPFYFYGGLEFPSGVNLKADGLHIDTGVKVKGVVAHYPLPTVITCFEVLEHVEPAHARRMVEKITELAKASEASGGECHIFISTPNWDPDVGAADNHVNEMRFGAVGYLLESAGLEVLHHYGTFASQRDIKPAMTDGDKSLFDRLSQYYDSNYLSTVFAPLYPALARNTLWHCRYTGSNPVFKIQSVTQPWTSSEHWKDLEVIEAAPKKKKK